MLTGAWIAPRDLRAEVVCRVWTQDICVQRKAATLLNSVGSCPFQDLLITGSRAAGSASTISPMAFFSTSWYLRHGLFDAGAN